MEQRRIQWKPFSGDWGDTLVVLLGAWGLIMLLWYGLKQVTGGYDVSLSNLAILPVMPAAALLAFRSVRNQALQRQVRRAWLCMGLAFMSYGAGWGVWTGYRLAGIEPMPSWSNFLFLAFYPLLLWGLLSLPAVPLPPRKQWQFWLDAAIVLLSGWSVLWLFVLEPAARMAEDGTWSRFLVVAYPVGGLILLIGVLVMQFRRPLWLHPAVLGGVVLGGALLAVDELTSSLLEYTAGYVAGGWRSVLSGVGMYALLISAHLQWRSVAFNWKEPTALSSRFEYLPYVSVGLSHALMIVGVYRHGHVPPELLWSEGMMLAVVLARLLSTSRENLLLSAENAVRSRDARFRALIQNASDVFLVIDASGTIIECSSAVEPITGYSIEKVIGAVTLDYVHPDDLPKARSVHQQALANPGMNLTYEVRVRRADGTYRVCEVIKNNLLHQPEVAGMVMTIREITERKRYEERLAYEAHHDSVTNLPNRLYFLDFLEQALARVRQSGLHVGVLFLDLDNFKWVNDSLGHHAGDQLLVAVAQRLRQALCAEHVVARLGGDEFTVLLEGIADASDVTDVVDLLTEEMRASFSAGGQEVFATFSIGVAIAAEGDRAQDLLRKADLAMYRAKNEGKATWALFSPEMDAYAVRRLQMETDLRRAVEEDEFPVHYQPIVELDSGKIVGLEALIRWRHPVRGLLTPGGFLSVAEETGLILPLERRVLQEAAHQIRNWQERFNVPLVISVNFCAMQYRNPALVDLIAAILEETRLAPQDLQLEMTENALMGDDRYTRRALVRLKRLGVRLAIDDFGKGFSSLGYLKRFPVDTVKIDQSFVAGLGSDPRDFTLTQAILTFAEALNLKAVAEGIETPEQLEQLKTLGCQLGQGYLFARPLPPEKVELLLAAQYGGVESGSSVVG